MDDYDDLTDNLFNAVRHNDLEKVINLIRQGANVLKKDYEGRTVLHCACTRGLLEIVKFLIEAGSNVLEKDNYGNF